MARTTRGCGGIALGLRGAGVQIGGLWLARCTCKTGPVGSGCRARSPALVATHRGQLIGAPWSVVKDERLAQRCTHSLSSPRPTLLGSGFTSRAAHRSVAAPPHSPTCPMHSLGHNLINTPPSHPATPTPHAPTSPSPRFHLNYMIPTYTLPRRDTSFNGRPSYGNTYAAVNAITGHINSFGYTQPLPKKRSERIVKVRLGGWCVSGWVGAVCGCGWVGRAQYAAPVCDAPSAGRHRRVINGKLRRSSQGEGIGRSAWAVWQKAAAELALLHASALSSQQPHSMGAAPGFAADLGGPVPPLPLLPSPVCLMLCLLGAAPQELDDAQKLLARGR